LTVLVDTSALIAAADRLDRWHPRVVATMRQNAGRLIVPAPLLSEVDYMLTARLGRGAALAFLRDVAREAFAVACPDAGEYRAMLALSDRYADLSSGLADLSIVVLAHRFQTRRILTFDQRHFRAMTPLTGGAFELLPADAPPATG
jgi:hypothetical protein